MPHRVLAVALVLLTAVLAACGSDDAGPPTIATPGLTRTTDVDGTPTVDVAPPATTTTPRDRFGGTPRVADYVVESVGPRSVLVATVGDSLTSGSPYFDPDPRNRTLIRGEADVRAQWQYWLARARPGTAVRNCGLAGRRTDQIAGEVDRCAEGAGALVIQGGTNDIAQGRTQAQAARQIRAMARRGKELGLAVLVTEVIPWNSKIPRTIPLLGELNRRIARIAEEEGVGLVRWFGLLEDPDLPDQLARKYTVDGAHPTVEGHRILGRAAARALDRALG